LERRIDFLNGSLVIGEVTKLARLTWERPTEQVVAAVMGEFATRDPLASTDEPFGEALRQLANGYGHGGGSSKAEQYPVVRNSFAGQDSDGGDWLALNPIVGQKLAWRRAADGMFRWVDQTGAMMAETIWWKDASLHHRPPKLDDEVGEGWLVVMSSAGFASLQRLLGPMKRMVRVRRAFTHERQRLRGSQQDVEDLPDAGRRGEN
jgi:hypothetical protein